MRLTIYIFSIFITISSCSKRNKSLVTIDPASKPLETSPRPNQELEVPQVGPIECGNEDECEVINLTNEMRNENSLSSLAATEACRLMAQDHAQYMANGGEFSHDRPGESYSQRAKRFGCVGGENIAMSARDAAQTVDLWMNSEGHRENILDPSFKTIGAGANKMFWVQCFSRDQE
jgi:uncharacterized protein YkwD